MLVDGSVITGGGSSAIAGGGSSVIAGGGSSIVSDEIIVGVVSTILISFHITYPINNITNPINNIAGNIKSIIGTLREDNLLRRISTIGILVPL